MVSTVCIVSSSAVEVLLIEVPPCLVYESIVYESIVYECTIHRLYY
jgi:hypothetical protein